MSLFGFLKQKNVCHLLSDPDGATSIKYRHFKDLLDKNDAVLDGLAALEQAYYGGETFTMGAVRQILASIGDATAGMVRALDNLSPKRYQGLQEAHTRILAETMAALRADSVAGKIPGEPLTLPLAGIGIGAQALVGGKGGNLALVHNHVQLPTPDGFVVTTAGFHRFMQESGLAALVEQELETISPLDLPNLEQRCARIREAILGSALPEVLSAELSQALAALARRLGGDRLLAVRSSAVGEDGAASFAGQYESVLNVPFNKVEHALLQVFASKYTPRAVLYRLRWGLDDGDAPMAALVLAMIDSRVSGVLYTVDPGREPGDVMRLDAVEGLGEKLVSGEAEAYTTTLVRSPLRVAQTQAGSPVPEDIALRLGGMGLALERYFDAPQDVEWCLDTDGELFVVQSRPMAFAAAESPAASVEAAALEGYTVLLAGGVCASPGASSGITLRIEGHIPDSIPDNAILVATNAAPELAALLDRAGGVITAMGGVVSHLASVAREIGVPALFGVVGCMEALPDGQECTLDASNARVYAGRVEALLSASEKPRSPIVNSPMHVRLRNALDRVSPLTLTDPGGPNFTPQGCVTLHDIVRYAHEMAMREMFGLYGEVDEGVKVAKLKAQVPLTLYCVDMGGGLRDFLTTCDGVTPEDLRSVPMRALWRGFTHPGISWSGAVAVDIKGLLTLMASSATTGGEGPGGDSYALLGADYVNLSARFGYHFANVDAFCGDAASKNHIRIRFAGGAGSFSGKCLRIAFLAKTLGRLGFSVETRGDVLDASLKGAPRQQTEEALDQVARLLAVSRLLDMAISGQAEIESMAEAFANGDYDLLSKRQQSPLPGFHLVIGDWERGQNEQGGPLARQDGSKWAPGLSRSFASVMSKLSGRRYQRFLDTVEAYFYFPLAIAKGSTMGDGQASLLVRPLAGAIDQAGGLAFGVQTAGTYLVLRLNALEDNLILFAFKDGRRTELSRARVLFAPGQWRELSVHVQGNVVIGYVDAKPYIVHHFETPPRGMLGLWSKADSIVEFADLKRCDSEGEKVFPI